MNLPLLNLGYLRSASRLISTLLLSAFLLACQAAPLPALTNVPKNTPPFLSVTKMSTDADENPPQVFSMEFTAPLPVPGALNSSGAEDSPFITPDGSTMYLFYTPDISVPPEKQLIDGVTGIYVSHQMYGQWRQPQRVLLQDPGKVALDGCEFVLGNLMWFCSARDGYSGINWFVAELQDNRWQNWGLADFPASLQVGELHISSRENELYFASERPGGLGNLDIWLSQMTDGTWGEPINLSVINSGDREGWPALNPDESELWFSRNDTIWRSKRLDSAWQPPQQMFAPLSGEPTLDGFGNVYFVHHYYQDGQMIEADIFVAYRK
jgi:hypothetical protein